MFHFQLIYIVIMMFFVPAKVAPFEQLVQEIIYASPVVNQSFLEAPIIAGGISALLLTIAILICALVAFTRRKTLCNSRNHDGNSSLKKQNEFAPLHDTLRKFNGQEVTPAKKSKSQSIASLATQDVFSDSYDIYPYATFQ